MKLNTEEGRLKARLVTYKATLTGKVFRFLSNLFDFQSHTIVLLYENRWEIEPLKKLSRTSSWVIFSRMPEGDKNAGMDGLVC